MREIKFRGQDLVSGNLLFGDLLHARGELLILEFGSKVARTVKKDSVAQLVGYDCDGKEIYEGDKVIDKDGDELTAVLISGSFYAPDDDYADMSHLKLKE